MRIDVIVPEGVSGPWRIEAFRVSEQESEMTLARAKITGAINEFVPTGNYKRLVREETVVMSNTPMEIRTNRAFIHRAKGKVLINGLGLGMVLSAILEKPEIKSVTVVEASEDVIKLVGPSFCDDSRVRWAAKKGMTERAFRTFLIELINDKPSTAKKVLELIVQNRTPSPHTQPAEDIAKAAVRGHLFASITSLNAVSKALGFDQRKIYVTIGGQQIHLAEKVASDNMALASGKASRTRGAGAGGFNRDIGNIEHRINDANTKISLLQGELKRWISTGEQPSKA